MKTRRKPNEHASFDSTLDAATLAEAFDAVKAEIAAVPDEQLVRMSVDVPRCTQVGFGAAARLDELRVDLEQLAFYDPAPVRKLRTYAAAALHAHLLAINPSPGQDRRLPAMLDEGRRLRANLMVAAETLAHFGLVPANQVTVIRHGTGNLDMASDLSALAVLLGDVWAEVKDKVPITRAMISRAGELGLELQIALGIRQVERGTLRKNEARKVRARAFTLFARAYDACRRGVTFLRWDEGDVDWYVPSFYATRTRRKATRRRPGRPEARPELVVMSDVEAAQ